MAPLKHAIRLWVYRKMFRFEIWRSYTTVCSMHSETHFNCQLWKHINHCISDRFSCNSFQWNSLGILSCIANASQCIFESRPRRGREPTTSKTKLLKGICHRQNNQWSSALVISTAIWHCGYVAQRALMSPLLPPGEMFSSHNLRWPYAIYD